MTSAVTDVQQLFHQDIDVLPGQLRVSAIFVTPGFWQMAPGTDAVSRLTVFGIGDEVQPEYWT